MNQVLDLLTLNFKKLNPNVAALTVAFGSMRYLAGKASPNTGATFDKSIDLLLARIGRDFVPAIEEAARVIQGIANAKRELDKHKEDFNSFINLGASAGRSLREALGIPALYTIPRDQSQMLRSMEGLPQSRSMSDEQFSQELGGAGLTANSLEGEILREQLKSLQDMGALLQNIDRNTQPQSGIFTGGGRL